MGSRRGRIATVALGLGLAIVLGATPAVAVVPPPTAWVGHRPTTNTGAGAADRHQRRQDQPLGIRGIRRVRTRPLGRQVLTGLGHRRCTA